MTSQHAISLIVTALWVTMPSALAQNPDRQVTEIAPDWLVVCYPQKINDLGELETKKHCRLEKSNMTALVRIDRSGIKIVQPFYEEVCENPPLGISVDRASIRNLPTKKQIASLKRGKMFARAQEGSWPYCSIDIETTSLEGFSAAYEEMLRRWRSSP